jgi:hypothetical protein
MSMMVFVVHETDSLDRTRQRPVRCALRSIFRNNVQHSDYLYARNRVFPPRALVRQP